MTGGVGGRVGGGSKGGVSICREVQGQGGNGEGGVG